MSSIQRCHAHSPIRCTFCGNEVRDSRPYLNIGTGHRICSKCLAEKYGDHILEMFADAGWDVEEG